MNDKVEKVSDFLKGIGGKKKEEEIEREPPQLRLCINCGHALEEGNFCAICHEFGKEQY